MKSMQLGVIGLGTMGANVARNAARNGATVAVFNRTEERTEEFIKNHGTEGAFIGCPTLTAFIKALKPPRAILLMVKAGDAVDALIDDLLPLLLRGDIIIDGGNSHFNDTARRQEILRKKGMHFIGMGISGGEEGALHGPSMMPGGTHEALEHVLPLFTAMAADDGAGGKCVAPMGPDGSGHFVKMVHNGIEYGLMQLLAETYDVMKHIGGLTNEELAEVYGSWNEGLLQSFLVEITAKVFQKQDGAGAGFLVDVIKDAAGQKGTGKWTTEAAMNLGVGIPTITAAVDARILSSDPVSRKRYNAELPESLPEPLPEAKPIAEMAKNAYLLASICDYLQGFHLLQAASTEYEWKLQLPEIARIWRGGCIIRSGLLPVFQNVFQLDDGEQARRELFAPFEGEAQVDLRRLVSMAIDHGIPVPALSASLNWYDTIRRTRLPQNLVQAQRDFFGAHTYERLDQEGTFHTEW